MIKSKLKKWGWKIAAAGAAMVGLLIMILAIVLPKDKSEVLIAAALDVQQKLGDNAKEHEVRIAVAETKNSEGKKQLERQLAIIEAEPDSRKRRQALINMHKEIL